MSEVERKPRGRRSLRQQSGPLPDRNDIDEADADLYKASYEEGQRTLDNQWDELQGLRNRAVSLTSFIGAATAFLVGTGLHSSQRDTLFYVLASVASALSAVYISLLFALLRPWRKKPWYYRMEPKTLINGFIETEFPTSKALFFRWLAEKSDDMGYKNEQLLSSLRELYRWLIVTGAAQVTVWAALVWAKG